MPLIGLSAHIIPYIMAMIFTMLVFNGDKQAVAENQLSANNILTGHLISIRGNQESTPDIFHYNTTTNAAAEDKPVPIFILYKRTCHLNPFYQNRFLQTLPVNAFSHRGPPSDLS